jgi:thioredoxin-like negative regulator of GroEL
MYESWPGASRSESNQAPAPVVRQPPDQGVGQGQSSAPGTVQPEVVETVAPPSGPAGFLLDEAARLRRSGDLDGAALSVERAMRIQPGNPWLGLELADIRLEQGNPSQAEQLAQRALAQAGGDRQLQARCWTLTAAAREARGDAAGAAVALAKASE